MADDTTGALPQEDRKPYPGVGVRSVPIPAPSRSLRKLDILRDVGSATLTELDRRCRWLDLREGDVLAAAGEQPSRIFFLLVGEVRFSLHTRTGKIVYLPPASAGTVVDGAGLGGGLRIPYSVEAGGYCVVASISARIVMELAERDRVLLQVLVASLVERQHLLVRSLVDLSTLGVRARIHNELIRLSREHRAIDGSGVIHPVPTHAALANRVGTHREAVSRELSHLQQTGMIRRHGDTIVVPNISRLAELQVEADA